MNNPPEESSLGILARNLEQAAKDGRGSFVLAAHAGRCAKEYTSQVVEMLERSLELIVRVSAMAKTMGEEIGNKVLPPIKGIGKKWTGPTNMEKRFIRAGVKRMNLAPLEFLREIQLEHNLAKEIRALVAMLKKGTFVNFGEGESSWDKFLINVLVAATAAEKIHKKS